MLSNVIWSGPCSIRHVSWSEHISHSSHKQTLWPMSPLPISIESLMMGSGVGCVLLWRGLVCCPGGGLIFPGWGNGGA